MTARREPRRRRQRDRRRRPRRRDGGQVDARRRVEVSAAGVADHYAGLLAAWVVDDVDAALVPRVESTGLRCRAVDTIMTDDDRAEAVARAALGLLG